MSLQAVLLTALLALASCGAAPAASAGGASRVNAPKPTSNAKPKKPASTPAEMGRDAAWRECAMPQGHCSVALPGTPALKMGTVNDNAREPFYRWTLVTKGEIYVAVYAPNSRFQEGKQTPQEFLAPFRPERSAEKQELTDAADVRVAGRPGRQFHTLRADGFSLLERTVVAEGGFYYLGVLTPVEGSYSENSLRFLGSLKLEH